MNQSDQNEPNKDEDLQNEVKSSNEENSQISENEENGEELEPHMMINSGLKQKSKQLTDKINVLSKRKNSTPRNLLYTPKGKSLDISYQNSKLKEKKRISYKSDNFQHVRKIKSNTIVHK